MKVNIHWLEEKFPTLQNLESLSQGGQKVVFTAYHYQHEKVVLKLLLPTQEEQSVKREVLAVDRVKASRVPKIIDAGDIKTPIGQCFWFLEEYVAGQELRACIASNPLPFRAIARLSVQVLEALKCAEEASIVHRDVKPANIIVSPQGDFWLLDFGIARHLSLTALTDVASRWGKFTAGYAPPEQFRNIQTEIDSRADLFALGVTIYESVTGSNPYHSVDDKLEVLRRVERFPLPRLSEEFVPADFADFIVAMTQRRRDHRPRTAKEALEWAKDITGNIVSS